MTSVTRIGGPTLSTITKSLGRRPTLVRKRDDTDFDSSQNLIPSSPSKKAKVNFDNEVRVRVMEEWEKAPQLVRDEVRRAMELHSLGDDTAYDQVKEVYSVNSKPEEAPSAGTLRSYTAALLSCVSTLNRSYSGLVHAVLASEWIGRDEAYTTLFLRFLGNLVSAQGTYLGDVLRMLVNHLTTSSPGLAPLRNQPVVTRFQIHRRAHAALRYILRLIPSASGVLSSVLTGAFPHSSDSKRAHVMFVRNLLHLIDYAPELRSEVLALITERLVKIDVQVQVDLEDLAEDVGDGVVQGIPQMSSSLLDNLDDMVDSESDAESDFSDESLDPEAQRAKDITSNVAKMDIILDILFAYYTPLFTNPSLDIRNLALDNLLAQFTTIILPTYRSRHTQFLLFHFAQASPSLIDTYVGACVHIAFDKGRSAIVRQSAAAYLASFVARGSHVPSSIVRDVFDYIGLQLHALRTESELKCRGPDLRRYATYYALVQALLYIFCFRWRDLEASPLELADDDSDADVDDPQVHLWVPGVKETLTTNIFSKLNPLKVCSPAIVAEFAKIARHLGIVYVYHLVETNKRLRLSQFVGSGRDYGAGAMPERETALSVRKDEGAQQLDEYFPFDPYHLPISRRWIEGDYREWTEIPGLHDEEEVESGSEEEESDGDIDDEGTGTDEESLP